MNRTDHNGREMHQCPRCFGRGYQPEARPNGGPGFYARTCPRCGGSGECPIVIRRAVSTDIKRGTLPQGYALTAADIGRPLTGPTEGFGAVLPGDVGKRVWVRDYGFTMENAAQIHARAYPTPGGVAT